MNQSIRIQIQNLKEMCKFLCNDNLFKVLGLSEKAKHLIKMRWKENKVFSEIAANYNVSQQRARILYLQSLRELNTQLNATAKQVETYKTIVPDYEHIERLNIPHKTTLISSLDYIRPEVIKILNSKNIFTISDILEFSKKDLLCIRGLGVKSVWDLNNLLSENGYNLKNEESKKHIITYKIKY